MDRTTARGRRLRLWWCLCSIPKLQHACSKLEHRPRIGLKPNPHSYHNCRNHQPIQPLRSVGHQYHAKLRRSLNHVDQERKVQRKHRFLRVLVAALSWPLKYKSGYGLRIGHSRLASPTSSIFSSSTLALEGSLDSRVHTFPYIAVASPVFAFYGNDWTGRPVLPKPSPFSSPRNEDA